MSGMLLPAFFESKFLHIAQSLFFAMDCLLSACSLSSTPFCQKYAIKNEFHLQPSSFFARNLHWM